MPQSLAKIYLHLVFSTKKRAPFLKDQQLRRETFQDEYRRLLTKYAIDFDERYVWD